MSVFGEVDSITAALAACATTGVDPGRFRMLESLGELEAPLAAMPFGVWRAPERRALRDQHDWRMGARLGPNAIGALAYTTTALLPGMRRVGVREILDAASSPGWEAYLASMNTDASL